LFELITLTNKFVFDIVQDFEIMRLVVTKVWVNILRKSLRDEFLWNVLMLDLGTIIHVEVKVGVIESLRS
jgi:hypothetical protein